MYREHASEDGSSLQARSDLIYLNRKNQDDGKIQNKDVDFYIEYVGQQFILTRPYKLKCVFFIIYIQLNLEVFFKTNSGTKLRVWKRKSYIWLICKRGTQAST